MVRIYARENATQRTKQVTAFDGSVLASVRWLAKQVLSFDYREITRVDSSLFDSEHAFKKAKESLEKGDGIGQPLISKVLKDMPGMTENGIRDSLSRLKASGHYALTLLNITRRIEAEAEAARLEAERLERERLEAEAARHSHRFRRSPWRVRQRRKLYKNCTF